MIYAELYRVLVTGGRDYGDPAKVYSWLDSVSLLYGRDIVLIHGGARGLDTIADSWAKARQQIHVCLPAQWDKYGKKAGMKRNAEMAALSGAHVVVAFRGGRGTMGMLSLVSSMDPQPVLILPDGEFWK